jgi:hypothetical protein
LCTYAAPTFWLGRDDSRCDTCPRTHDFSYFVCDAILKQGELSVHEAVAQVAKEHNAKLNTVRRAYSRAQVSKERAHGNRLLTDDHEYSLCGIILAFASAGISISRQDLMNIIRTQYLQNADWQGDSWVTKFLKRRSQWIGARATQALDRRTRYLHPPFAR